MEKIKRYKNYHIWSLCSNFIGTVSLAFSVFENPTSWVSPANNLKEKLYFTALIDVRFFYLGLFFIFLGFISDVLDKFHKDELSEKQFFCTILVSCLLVGFLISRLIYG